MLKYRIILGLLISAVLLVILYFDSRLALNWPAPPSVIPPGTLLVVTFSLVLPFAIHEMQHLLARERVQISMRICVIAAILCMVWPWFEQLADQIHANPDAATHFMASFSRAFRTIKPHYLVPTVLAASMVGAFIMHSRNQQVDGAIASAGGSLLAIVYLGVLPGFFLPIRLTHSAGMVLAILVMVKFADIGAFFVGRSLGRHKLIPWLSPGKTVEGFIGGILVAASMGAAFTCLPQNGRHYTGLQGALAGALLGAVGQLGDLLESLLKRDAGVKDSGQVPGFGGILDMLDSPLLAAPVAYWLLKLVPAS